MFHGLIKEYKDYISSRRKGRNICKTESVNRRMSILKYIFTPNHDMYDGVRPINIYLLRLFYFLMGRPSQPIRGLLSSRMKVRGIGSVRCRCVYGQHIRRSASLV